MLRLLVGVMLVVLMHSAARAQELSVVMPLQGGPPSPAAQIKDGSGALKIWGRVVDPDGDCQFKTQDKQLTTTVPGTPHDLSAELDRMNAPRAVSTVNGDFTLAVIVKGELNTGEATIPGRTAYNGAGLLVMQDERNYIRLERAALSRGGSRSYYVNFEARIDGQVQRIGAPSDFVMDPEVTCLLRIVRVGDTIRGAVRQGTGAWHEMEPKRIELKDPLIVGVAAINASNQAFSPTYTGLLLAEKRAPEANVSDAEVTVIDAVK